MIGYDIYFIQVLTSTETSLCRTERQDVPYDRAAPHGRPLQLPLFLHKRHFFSHSRFNFALSGPAFLYKPLPELVEQLERSDVITTNHKCRAEAADTLFYGRIRINSSQQTINKFLEKATVITAKLSPQIFSPNFVQRSHHASARRKVLLINRRKLQMIWGHVILPLFYKWQR